MPETFRYPPEAQPHENLTLDEDGRQVQIATDRGAPVIATSTDGTETLRPSTPLLTYGSPLVPADPARDRSARFLAELAVAKLLQGLVCFQEDAKARVEGLPPGMRAFALETVFQGWPRQTDEPVSLPVVTVVVDGKVSWDESMRGPAYLDESRGRWKPNTVLRRVGSATPRVQVLADCADKEQREAIESAIERLLLVEECEDMFGRRVVLPEYYDQVVRIGLLDSDDDEITPQEIAAGRWPLRVSVQVEIDRVILVQAPPSMETLFGSDVGPSVVITT